MMGYDDSSKAYEPQKKKILISRDVVFDETKLSMTHLSSTEISDDLIFPNILDGSSNPKSLDQNPNTSDTINTDLARFLQRNMSFLLFSIHDSIDENDSVK